MYAKLVYRNAKRSAKDYLIYIVTLTICVTLFHAFLSISSSYYQPDIGTAYEITAFSDGIKLAVCAITLLLLFLIRYVNSYMLRRKQKEFAVQSIMGMEQKTIGWLFFAETFLMGAISIAIGIALGVLCSQFMSAMLLASYGHSYELTWTLFPDTVLWTVGFFTISFFVVGLFNVRTIRKIKIIDMLSADRQNEPDLKKNRFIPAILVIYLVLSIWMLETGIQKMIFFFDPRFAFPLHILFWGNIIFPAFTLLWSFVWLLKKKVWTLQTLLIGLLACTVPNTVLAALVPVFESKYYLTLGAGTINQYLLFVVVDLLFLICGIIYLSSSAIVAWKSKSPAHRYQGNNLFFFGQIISKLTTTTKTMTLICITLTMAILMFIIAPVLTEWSMGYLDSRSMYDVQINSRYNDVYEKNDLPTGNYEVVTDFLTEEGIAVSADCAFSLYLPNCEDFHDRVKHEFPVVAISLSDYNAIREMLGYEAITLEENEFTTQWHTTATTDEQEEFIRSHAVVATDVGRLTLSEQASYQEAMGETLYNSYTRVVYVFPDSVCQNLLSVNRNRYIQTSKELSYSDAAALENRFIKVYPELSENGVGYSIRLSTLQINEAKGMNFILKTAMIYGAVVLMVICLTILSLQQLLDAGQYRYRFAVLRKLGVEEQDIKGLVMKQLGVWFGLPVVVSIIVSAIVVAYFLQSVSVEISAYIGIGALITQLSITISILILLLVCYFLSTWILFRRSITE